MTRKDTILVAVVINAALLAILFATAIIYDTEKEFIQVDAAPIPIAAKESVIPEKVTSHSSLQAAPGDEVDNVLTYYNNSPNNRVATEVSPDHDEESFEYSAPGSSPPNPQADFVEVQVKKGDMLEKIARVNGTTTGAIKSANQLKSERLQIGQILKIPVQKTDSSNRQVLVANASAPPQSSHKQEIKEGGDPVYYVIKGGDSPWKLARQLNVKFEDILRLNGLDEEKARNLKVGDRIRVK
jgi:peptidoglycan endopeptidase LytF